MPRRRLRRHVLKVCIVGAGAIGGFLGLRLAQAGADVSLVARGAHLAAMRAHGVRLQIEGREEVARLALHRPTRRSRRAGLRHHRAEGARHLRDAVPAMRPAAGDARRRSSRRATAFLIGISTVPAGRSRAACSNRSIRAERNGTRFGPERAIGCVVFPATEVVAPGVIRHEHGRKFPLGEPSGERSERIERLAALFEAGGLEAPIRSDIRDEIWLKLWGNLCLNPISALTCATVDVDHPATPERARPAAR